MSASMCLARQPSSCCCQPFFRQNQQSITSQKDFYMNRITLEPGKRGGRPCIRGLRITVYDVLSMLSSGMSQQEIQDDFPELTVEDILASLAYAAEREHQVYSYKVQ